MSRVTRLKHVKREIDTDDLDLPTGDQQIVRVIGSKGNNLLEVESSEDAVPNFLVSMPSKFRKNIWIKRGNYLLVDPIQEGDKVKAEVIRVLSTEHQKEFQKHHVWPKKFTNKREHEEVENSDEEDDDLPRNPNRKNVEEQDDSSDDSSELEND